MSVSFRLKMCGLELRERCSVTVCIGGLSLSNVDGRGTTAAEKQQSLQSLICKYANERVIKIGRLSVALWLLMNSNLQERGRGWWAKNEEKEQDAIVLFLAKELEKEWLGAYRVKRPYWTEEKLDIAAFRLESNIKKTTMPTQNW